MKVGGSGFLDCVLWGVRGWAVCLFGSFRDEANVFYGGVGIVGMGIGYRCFRVFR